MGLQEFDAGASPYSYIGDIPALGSLQLTELAKSFEQLEITPLTDFFPDRNIPERTIVTEQIIEGLGITPIVKFGVPNGGYMESNRVQSFMAHPAVVRENDYVDQHLINQLRKVGTVNQAWNPADIVKQRVQQLLNRHARVKDLFRAKALLGGIVYKDPRTNVSINASTNIPTHNFYSYDGFNATVASGASIPGTGFVAAGNLVNDKGRPEALLFKSTDGRAGVKWTDPKADLISCLQLIKQWLYNTNKNRFTELVISSDLMTIIMQNDYIKSLMGIPSLLVLNQPTSTVAGNAALGTGAAPASFITMGPGGDISSIAGLNIRIMDGLYRDPVTGKIQTFWPVNKVALVAKTAMNDRSASLGFTYHCSGEAIDGAPGLFMRSSDIAPPPATTGMTMQLGDAFLPVVTYPHWICILDVCEPEDVFAKQILQSNLEYGTF